MTRPARGSLVRPLGRALRRLDHAVGRLAGRRSVLVEARTPMNLAVLRPVFDRLLADDRLRVQFTGAEHPELNAAFDASGLRNHVIDRDAARWRRFDLYMNADPWDAVSLRRVDRQVNFFHGVAGKYNLDCPADLPLDFGRYDRVAFPNEGRRRAYVSAGIVAEDRAVLVGFPKADALLSPAADARTMAAALGLDRSRPTVIFAPTFSPHSALNTAGDAIVEALLASGCNVIAKLHDRSFDPDPRYSGGIDWRQRMARFNGPTFILAEGGDSTPYVLASDVMVTDHSSIGFEFCAADRPLVVFDAPGLIEAARINQEKVSLLRSAADVVTTPAQLAGAVRDALASPRHRAAERRQAASAVFFDPGTATDRALRLVYGLLALPVTATAHAATSAGAVRAA